MPKLYFTNTIKVFDKDDQEKLSSIILDYPRNIDKQKISKKEKDFFKQMGITHTLDVDVMNAYVKAFVSKYRLINELKFEIESYKPLTLRKPFHCFDFVYGNLIPALNVNALEGKEWFDWLEYYENLGLNKNPLYLFLKKNLNAMCELNSAFYEMVVTKVEALNYQEWKEAMKKSADFMKEFNSFRKVYEEENKKIYSEIAEHFSLSIEEAKKHIGYAGYFNYIAEKNKKRFQSKKHHFQMIDSVSLINVTKALLKNIGDYYEGMYKLYSDLKTYVSEKDIVNLNVDELENSNLDELENITYHQFLKEAIIYREILQGLPALEETNVQTLIEHGVSIEDIKEYTKGLSVRRGEKIINDRKIYEHKYANDMSERCAQALRQYYLLHKLDSEKIKGHNKIKKI